jgi:hypothetical protein
MGRLGQLIDNLLANAVKFTPTGGRVEVVACPIDGGWRLEVTDTGIGISADELGQLFQRFFRATNARRQANSGSRLGLAIARRVVELREGTVEISSLEGSAGPRTGQFAVLSLRRKLGWEDLETSPLEAVRGFGYRYRPLSRHPAGAPYRAGLTIAFGHPEGALHWQPRLPVWVGAHHR